MLLEALCSPEAFPATFTHTGKNKTSLQRKLAMLPPLMCIETFNGRECTSTRLAHEISTYPGLCFFGIKAHSSFLTNPQKLTVHVNDMMCCLLLGKKPSNGITYKLGFLKGSLCAMLQDHGHWDTRNSKMFPMALGTWLQFLWSCSKSPHRNFVMSKTIDGSVVSLTVNRQRCAALRAVLLASRASD